MVQYAAPALFSAAVLLYAPVTAAPVPTNPGVYDQRRALNWCGPSHEANALPGLDDRDCVKRLPPTFDRGFVCPAIWDETSDFTLPTARAADNFVHRELAHIVPPNEVNDAKVAVAIVRRHDSAKPTLRYIGNGAAHKAHQPWSSSKIFAAAHAGAHMREVLPSLGLDASEKGSQVWQLSDLLTIIATYDVNETRPGVSSNALAAYFQEIGGHESANRYLHTVVGAASNESFGGDYGELVPKSVGFTFVPKTNESAVNIQPDPAPRPPVSNHMSSLTMAEWLRRIVLAREEGASWVDSSAILYGAAQSTLFTQPELQWGGMSMGTDVYLQQAVNLSALDARAKGQWRIFSKLGAGISSTEHPGEFEITLNAYGCFPVLDDKGAPILNRGVEFTLSAGVTAELDRFSDAAMQSLVANVTSYLLANYDGESRVHSGGQGANVI